MDALRGKEIAAGTHARLKTRDAIMRTVFGALLVSLLFTRAQGSEFFISPAGSDRNPGTREKPFQTLERARDAVRSLNEGKGISGKDRISVWLSGGTYPLSRTFELGPNDGGLPGAPVTYSALPGATVRLSGGITVPARLFHPVHDADALRRLPDSSKSHVMEADLKAPGISDFGMQRQFGFGLPVVPASMELFWNDTVLQVARYPNRGGIALGPILDPGSVPRNGDHSNRGGKFRYTDARHARWAGIPDVWLQGFFNYGFADDRIRVASIDTVRHEVTLASPHMYGLASGENFNEYVALNLLEELDEPGEWYVDREKGLLFLWPPGDITSALLAVSVVEKPLVALDHVSDVVLRSFVIENGRGIGISIEGGERDSVNGCVIRNVGTVGVMMGKGARPAFPGAAADDYQGVPASREVGSFNSQSYVNTVWDRDAGKGHVIEGCEVYNTGSGGIILGGGTKRDLIPGGCAVTDCRIHDYDRRNKAGAAGVIVDGCGNIVAHNEIYNGDLQAIFVHGNDHRFEFNLIHDVARNSNDASAWYLGRDPSDQGNIVRWNFFHHVGRPDRKWTMGVYCDDATCGVQIEGNVFYKVASYGTIYSNGGHDIVVKNNIFIEGYGPAYLLKSMWYDFGMDEIPYFFGAKGIYTKRLTESVNIKSEPYSTRYPLLKDWLDLLPDGKTYVGMRPRRNVFNGNVLVKYDETFRLVGQYAQCEFGENYITHADPGFVDAGKMNFTLKDDSAVYREIPGFKRIPFERIGPRNPLPKR
jgi:hypothetical protein